MQLVQTKLSKPTRKQRKTLRKRGRLCVCVRQQESRVRQTDRQKKENIGNVVVGFCLIGWFLNVHVNY